MTRPCLDCDPLQCGAVHISDRIMNVVDIIFDALCGPLKETNFLKKVNDLFAPTVLRLGTIARIFKEIPLTHDLEPQIYNRTLVVFREARKQGMAMTVFTFRGRCTKFFALMVQGEKLVFDELPTITLKGDDVPFSDKFILKCELRKRGLPTPEGRVFKTVSEAIEAADTLGYPLVVKPRRGSLSKHTTCGIVNEDELRKAVKSAKMIAREIVVERHVVGNVFRVTVVGGRVGACCLREAPHVIGDGVGSISTLVAQKNADPRRGPAHQKNSTLHHISITPTSCTLLVAQGMTLNSIPVQGEKVYLHSKVILGAGADIHDCTDAMHPGNRKLFEDVAKIWNAPLIGFDAIFQDISRPWQEQECGIIEANSKPYIDMHHVPVTGQPRNIAKLLLDYVLTKHI